MVVMYILPEAVAVEVKVLQLAVKVAVEQVFTQVLLKMEIPIQVEAPAVVIVHMQEVPVAPE